MAWPGRVIRSDGPLKCESIFSENAGTGNDMNSCEGEDPFTRRRPRDFQASYQAAPGNGVSALGFGLVSLPDATPSFTASSLKTPRSHLPRPFCDSLQFSSIANAHPPERKYSMKDSLRRNALFFRLETTVADPGAHTRDALMQHVLVLLGGSRRSSSADSSAGDAALSA